MDRSTLIVCIAAIVKVYDTELIKYKLFPAVTHSTDDAGHLQL